MDESERWYRALDLEPGASAEEVKRAWRDLTKVWHPDRFQGDPRMEAKAEEKLKAINFAYQQLADLLDQGKPMPQQPTSPAQPESSGQSAAEAGEDPRPSARMTSRASQSAGSEQRATSPPTSAAESTRQETQRESRRNRILVSASITAVDLVLFAVLLTRLPLSAVESLTAAALKSATAGGFLALVIRPLRPYWGVLASTAALAMLSFVLAATQGHTPRPVVPADVRPPQGGTSSSPLAQHDPDGRASSDEGTIPASVAPEQPAKGFEQRVAEEEARFRRDWESAVIRAARLHSIPAKDVARLDQYLKIAGRKHLETVGRIDDVDAFVEPLVRKFKLEPLIVPMHPSAKPTDVPPTVTQGRLYAKRAHALWEAQRWKEAAACFDEALRLNPGDQDSQVSREKLSAWSGGTCSLKDAIP